MGVLGFRGVSEVSVNENLALPVMSGRSQWVSEY